MMEIHSVAKSLETVSRFLGDEGWATVMPLLVKAMNGRKIIRLKYQKRAGVYCQIKLDANQAQM